MTTPDIPNLPISNEVGFAALFTMLLAWVLKMYSDQQKSYQELQRQAREDARNVQAALQENTRAMTNMDATMREMMRMFEKFEQRLNHIESKTG